MIGEGNLFYHIRTICIKNKLYSKKSIYTKMDLKATLHSSYFYFIYMPISNTLQHFSIK